MAQMVKNPPAMQETWVWSLDQKDPLEKGMATHSSFFLSFFLFFKLFIYLNASGLRWSMWDLVPWPGTEPKASELGAQSLSHWTTREVPPLQDSCLENFMDGGAWRDTVPGVTKSWTQWRKQWHPTPVLLPGESHGWRSLVGCSPWGC